MSQGSGGLKWTLVIAVVAVLFGAVGFLAAQKFFMRGDNPAQDIVDMAAPQGRTPHQLLGSDLPVFSMQDLTGQAQSSPQWKGKVLLVNFWASWCPPCREEIPGFVELQHRYAAQGFQVVGIAIDEPAAAQGAAEELGVNYPVLVGADAAVDLSNQLGDGMGALPYSVLVDRQGKLRYVKPGALKADVLEVELKKLL